MPHYTGIENNIDISAASNLQNVTDRPQSDDDETTKRYFRKYNVKYIPADFIKSDVAQQALVHCIDSILLTTETQDKIDNMYSDVCNLYYNEMDNWFRSNNINSKSHKKIRNLCAFFFYLSFVFCLFVVFVWWFFSFYLFTYLLILFIYLFFALFYFVCVCVLLTYSIVLRSFFNTGHNFNWYTTPSPLYHKQRSQHLITYLVYATN